MQDRRLIYLDTSQIQADPQSIRQDTGDTRGLSESIAEQGLLQPIGVIHMWGDTYRVVFGHRRLEAARQLGWQQIPCLLLETNPDELLVPQLVENLQRLDLNDLEKAQAMERLRQRFEAEQPHLSSGELDEMTGHAIGLSDRSVRRYLSLLELSPIIQEWIRQGELTVTQAQHLVRIPNPRTREELAREATEEGLTAAQISELASFFAANPSLTIETALQALEEGVKLRRQVPPDPVEGPLQRLARSSLEQAAAIEAAAEERTWEMEEELPPEGLPPLEAGPDTPDWARLQRFRSLDQVLDEAGRISRVVYEGDLEQWASQDEKAPVKMRLLLRHLRAVVENLERLCQKRGWE
ncbi:MAG: ParB/RepB/Spo0J family partition protein [Chloroflexia bacterium]|nr:ParB/RepB/Spo0J family partition protein [Chloroflexia bacterium]